MVAPSPSMKRRLKPLAGGVSRKAGSSLDLGVVLKDGRDAGASVARTRPHCPRCSMMGSKYEGQRYRSLTMIAARITGAHWSGLSVFWYNQAALPFAIHKPPGSAMSRPAVNRTRRNGAIRCARLYPQVVRGGALEQEFNSLQAQREACEAFIKSQRHEGWVCLPDGYDDGGLSGANDGTARACSSCSQKSRRAWSTSWSSTRSTG